MSSSRKMLSQRFFKLYVSCPYPILDTGSPNGYVFRKTTTFIVTLRCSLIAFVSLLLLSERCEIAPSSASLFRNGQTRQPSIPPERSLIFWSFIYSLAFKFVLREVVPFRLPATLLLPPLSGTSVSCKGFESRKLNS